MTFKFAHDSPTTSPYQAAAETFKEMVEEGTDGRVKVNIFPAAQLGDETVALNGLKSGAVDATIVNVPSLEPVVDELKLFFLPFLFRDQAHALEVAEGPVGQRMVDATRTKVGAEILGWGSIGEAALSTNDEPVQSLADMNGLKVRTSTSAIAIETYEALGALPAQLAFGELYQALQSGVVDSSDSGVVDIVDSKFYQVLESVTLLSQFVRLAPVMVSERAMAELSEEDQQVVREAGKAAAEAELAELENQSAEALQTLKDEGVNIVELSEAQRQEFVDAVQSVYERNADAVGGQGLIDEVRTNN